MAARPPLPPLPPPNKRKRHPPPRSFSPTSRELPPLPFSSPPPGEDPTQQLEFPCEDDKFTLPELVDGYSPLFPIRVRVVKGYYGERGESSAIATDELYNFHFIKRAKVVTIKDVHGNKYVIPLNSAAKFGLVQGQGSKVYNTVEDLLNAPSPPVIVAVKAGYVGDDPKTSVAKNEVLIVQGAAKEGGRFKLNRQTMLKTFSITKNEEKLLPKEVFGKFTTEPFYTQIYLMELLEHIKDPIPSKVRLFLDFEGDQPLPDHLISENVTIDRLYMETSVISSSLSEEELKSLPVLSQCDSISTMEIPINLEIEVSVIPPFEENDYEKLTVETMALLQNFDPSKVQHMESNEDDDEYSYTAQDQFFKAVRKGFENDGMKIDTPRKMMPVMSGSSSSKKKKEESEKKSDDLLDADDYVDIDEEDFKPPPAPPKRFMDAPRSAPPIPGSPPVPDGPKKRLPNSTSDSSPSTGHYNTPRSVSVDGTNDSEGFLRAQSYIRPVLKPRPVTPKKGVSLDTPRSRSPSPPPIPPPMRIEPSPEPPTRNEHFPVLRKTSREVPPQPMKRRSIASPERISPTFSFQEDLTECQRELKSLKGSIAQLGGLEGRMASLEKDMKEVKAMLKSLSSQQNGSGGGRGDGHEGGGDDEHDPKAVLRMLDPEQVLQVLGILRMNKYKEVFKEAQIDGEILADCDEEILEKELTVTSRLDRLKLTQIISGKRSVSEVLHKPNRSYVAFAPS